MTARALRRLAVPVVVAVTAAGCGGAKTVALHSTPSSTVAPGASDAAPDTATTATSATDAAGAASTTAAPGSHASTPTPAAGTHPGAAPTSGPTLAPAPGATATTAKPGGSGGAHPVPPASTAPNGSAPAPAAPGTYQVKQSGSFTAAGSTTQDPPTGSLVIDPADGGGAQVSHRFVQQGKDASDTTVAYRPSGPVITTTSQQGPGGSIVCTFTPAIPAPPQPPSVGSSFSSTGACGQFTTAVKGSITGTRSVVLDGVTYAAVVIDTTLSFSGAITGNGTEEDWYVPALRLAVHQSMTTDGKYGAFPFSSSLTTDLTSAKPS